MLSTSIATATEVRIGDVGGQKTLRSYWRNYFEKTDALIWVVDATDRLRVGDCKHELAGLLLEEVSELRAPRIASSLLVALDGCESFGLLEQDRYRWMYEQRRNPTGKERPKSSWLLLT